MNIQMKRLFCVFFFCALLFTAFAQINLQHAGYGDVEPDGIFNADDVARIKDHLMEKIDLLTFYEGEESYTDPTGHALTIADANRDGVLDLEDIAWLRKTYNADSEITIYLNSDYDAEDPSTHTIPMVFVRIPGGTFDQGSPAGERGHYDDEGPLHSVTIAYDYYMAKVPVTQEQWLAVAESWPDTDPSEDYGLGEDYPAYNVSWNDIRGPNGFLDQLNAHLLSTGQNWTVRLPSESEWEYAARAGTQTRFYFGDSLSQESDLGVDGPTDSTVYPGNRTDYMWFGANNIPSGSKAVGQKLPNAFGLYDMLGNVWEYCEDDGHDDYNGAPTDGSAWVDSPRHWSRVLRGGTGGSGARHCRSARRIINNTIGRPTNSGFRVLALQIEE